MHWSDNVDCLYISPDVRVIDTLEMMMQYNLPLIHELYESVIILLYYHCAFVLPHPCICSSSVISILYDQQKVSPHRASRSTSPDSVAQANPPVNWRSHNNDLVHRTTASHAALSLLVHVLNSSDCSLT